MKPRIWRGKDRLLLAAARRRDMLVMSAGMDTLKRAIDVLDGVQLFD